MIKYPIDWYGDDKIPNWLHRLLLNTQLTEIVIIEYPINWNSDN